MALPQLLFIFYSHMLKNMEKDTLIDKWTDKARLTLLVVIIKFHVKQS